MAKARRAKRTYDPTYLPAHLQKLIDLLPLNQRVHQSVIFEAYGRKPEYARRIRKIVSEYGWDIERVRGKNGANDDYYIRRSEQSVRPWRIRDEVKPKKRQQIYERDGFRCAMCGADVSDRQLLTLPQCDHKVPAERGGASVDANLQTLCTRCNLKKRQACKHCTLKSCQDCPYAFPENFDHQLILYLSEDAKRRLDRLVEQFGMPPAVIVERLLQESS